MKEKERKKQENRVEEGNGEGIKMERLEFI